MTREEAAIIVGNIPIDGSDQCYSIPEYQEAKTMAIEALTAQPCNDYVSREAINALQKYRYNCGETAITVVSLASINSLPPVTPKQRWIPVSERLPECGEEVLVSRRYHFYDADKDENDVSMLYYAGTDEFGAVFHDRFGGFVKNVTAWMPLPEPYNER